jgi:hypothetical protein
MGTKSTFEPSEDPIDDATLPPASTAKSFTSSILSFVDSANFFNHLPMILMYCLLDLFIYYFAFEMPMVEDRSITVDYTEFIIYAVFFFF